MIILFIFYTSFLYCNEFYIRIANTPHKYLKGIKGEDVHTTPDVALADTFTLTENPNNKGWYYVNVTGKDLVMDIGWNDMVLKYYVKEGALPAKQQFYFVLLPNLEFGLKNANGKCMDLWPDKDIFRRLPCNYDKNINQRFQIITKEEMVSSALGTKDKELTSTVASILKNESLIDKITSPKNFIDKINPLLTKNELNKIDKKIAVGEILNEKVKTALQKKLLDLPLTNNVHHHHHHHYDC